jgi:hypothetical protein
VALLAKASNLQAILAPPTLVSELVNQKVLLSWIGDPARTFRLDVSFDLKTWSNLTTNFNITGNLFSYATDVGRNAQFFRVVRQ